VPWCTTRLVVVTVSVPLPHKGKGNAMKSWEYNIVVSGVEVACDGRKSDINGVKVLVTVADDCSGCYDISLKAKNVSHETLKALVEILKKDQCPHGPSPYDQEECD
jgi:hypothetical protein